jgi:hypothetical protein
MQLVYGLVPKDGSLEALIERKAKQLATQIVLRTSNSMKLEEQENSRLQQFFNPQQFNAAEWVAKVKAAAHNAIFLLNVGPMPNGKIQPEFTDTLKKMGKWLQQNGASIYGTRAGTIAPKDWGGFTQKGKTVYMHILTPPNPDGYIFVDGMTQKIVKAVLFNGKQEVKFKQIPEGTFIYTRNMKFDEVDTIVELMVE